MKVKNEDLYLTISRLLKSKPLPSEPDLEKIIRLHAKAQEILDVYYNENDIQVIKRHIMHRDGIGMSDDITLVEHKTKENWLPDYRSTNAPTRYWDRYVRLLQSKGYPRLAVLGIDTSTEELLGDLSNPQKKGKWSKRGLVVGHVQSGKTANYTGLICKAADAGYKVIIILAGTLNALREQTQERIDEGFLGFNSNDRTPLGVGEFPNQTNITPASFTDRKSDFHAQKASQRGISLDNLQNPAVFVIKKWGSTLENLRSWLSSNPDALANYPLLLIDDEADYASINTKKEGYDPTTTNEGIRRILKLFPKHAYVGYTATPFANIFITPSSDQNMLLDQDLFPSDFIRCLGIPEDYFGPNKIFGTKSAIDVLRPVGDNEDFIPIKHKKDDDIVDIPPSLKHAIRSFILTISIRKLREHENAHNSMMINCSRLTNIQNQLANSVENYLKRLQNSCKINCSLTPEIALINPEIKELELSCKKEFPNLEFSWTEIQAELVSSALKIVILRLNASSDHRLEYSKDDFPSGRSVIAVGGISLSRGITLEGLSISYLLRNTAMYDTLMQMGRWFGYRNGYEDLCRIFMQDDAIRWYSHISAAIDELREDLKEMIRCDSSPRDFGLRVRSHPDRLIVTAKNKMQSSREMPELIELDGRCVETAHLHITKEKTTSNLSAFNNLIVEIEASNAEVIQPASKISGPELGTLWRQVPSNLINDFINQFDNNPASWLTNTKAIVQQIDKLRNDGVNQWDVLLRSQKAGKKHPIAGRDTGSLIRKFSINSRNGIERITINKSRIGDATDEGAGLKKETIQSILPLDGRKTVAGHQYRRQPSKPPLLILYLIELRDPPADIPNILPAFGLSFPGNMKQGRARRLITYTVNSTWFEQYFGQRQLEEEEDYA